jgi:hypothetical protein
MAQKRTDYSKFTQPNGTIQVLMLWASVALHLAIGSNLGLFGRLDPIKVKPAGGTVRVVDLTPAEQTRVPESAKSRPLPIAQIPVNPETATRSTSNQLPQRNPGASAFVPPRNPTQLPPPSSQIPRSPSNRIPSQPPQPSVPNSPTSSKPELSAPKPPRISQQEGTDSSSPNDNGNKIKVKTRNRPQESKENDGASPPQAPIEQEKIDGVKPERNRDKPQKNPEKPTKIQKSRELLQAEFDKSIRELKESSAVGINNVIERPTKRLNKPYSSGNPCSREQNGSIFIAFLLDENGFDVSPKPSLQFSPFLIDIEKDKASSLFDTATKQASQSATEDHEKRSPEQKKAEKGKNILYKFIFEYSASTCRS